ncbi:MULTISPECIES: double-strand break repair helicase AddA [Rhodomicrobium]|uniref:double-strand break repair helicase AddA n=1 Tax=Rhodomicrobium TaxID=1068 RepID=UPI000B4A83E1|nr:MULTISPECIES: double-strand break repair helicase AddA [Rhodomicrobium]
MTATILDFPTPDLASVRENARRQQMMAADPACSAWVSANAGTGKTYVLVLRVLRLLLSGAPPQSILCLTFTKAAAAEMSNRLIARLGAWAAKPDAGLTTELTGILERAPTADELAFARCLFAKVLDAPGGLKIMTIHAFCDRVLRRFPLEAGVPPSFTILTEDEQSAAMQEAADAVLHEAAREPDSALGMALKTAVAHAGEDRFQDLLRSVAGRRKELEALIREQDGRDPYAGIEQSLRTALGVGRDATAESILDEQAATATDTLIAHAVAALRLGGKLDKELAGELAKAQGAEGAQRLSALTKAFLTEKAEARSDARFISKAVRAAQPGIAEELCRARDAFAALECQRRALLVACATAALLRLADAVLQRYEHEKTQRTAIDFDGLIARTAALFQRSDAAAWVLFRLDSDLTHILVDEAQDTSPAQWALVKALTAEFFAGEGVEDKPRTLFAVGDEKQSIYGFQGAVPRQFAETGRDYSARAIAAAQNWLEAPLALSFRSTSAVLGAVDLVFSDRSRTPGLTADGRSVRHYAHRDGEAGLVEIWPVEKAEPRDPVPAWEPFSERAGAPPPAVTLANRIALQIRHWLDSGERLASLNRAIRPGDILILVRKRAPFAAPMVRALKNLGIPVAGADRMRLTEQLAIMDLMALGDFLLLPEDDLTLAALLKSPVFGLGDDDLFAIGHDRPGSLWDALRANPAYAEPARQLQSWLGAAASEKPFEFYMARLENDGLRKKLLGRLGPEASDAIDEFLNLALTFEAGDVPSLQGFLHWLRVSEAEIKRDMEGERDEVRVMTVHGSKGLEANIIFLADTCSARSNSRGGLIMLPPSPGSRPGTPELPAWLLPGSQLVPPIREACEALRQAESEEYQRLLYVAMTRARDRLYLTGFEGRNARDKGCWYDLISDGLAGRLTEVPDGFGNMVRRMECAQTVPARVAETADAAHAHLPMPDWYGRAAPGDSRPVIVNPSRLGLDRPGTHAPTSAPRRRGEALLRGRLVHRLLEILPLRPAPDWLKAGTRFLAAEAKALPPAERDALLAAVIGILSNAEFAAIFQPGARAEAPLAMHLPPLEEGAPSILISGQVDRLICGESDILIVDFKSGAGMPETPDGTPEGYLVQLAAYRVVLQGLFPGKTVRAALLWTETPQIMAIPSALLDRGQRLLYESLRSGHLDLPTPHT